MSTKTIELAPSGVEVPLLQREVYTAEDLADLLRVSKRTIFRLRARGVLPAPMELSTNIIRWRSSDIRAYLAGLKTRKIRRR
jgi:predicted DNA-binding transcriptional regulator AlpA